MKTPQIIVVRISGRAYRDLRITTHCGLVARAFGAKKIILSQDSDTSIPKTIQSVTERFGGDFEVAFTPNIGQQLKKLKKEGYCIIHLTMYGEKIKTHLTEIKKKNKIAIIIGADKVPASIYQQADYNIGITNQPHSEVAALAITMHEIMGGREEEIVFTNRKLEVIPTPKGKHVNRLG